MAAFGRYPTDEQWVMLQEMRVSGDFSAIRLLSDYHYVWDIRAIREDDDSSAEVWLSGPASHEELGDAIEAAYRSWKGEAVMARQPRTSWAEVMAKWGREWYEEESDLTRTP